MTPYAIAALFMASFTGFGYLVARAVLSGAESYSGTYTQDTSRQFEDIFLFIPSRRIAEAAWALAGVVFLLAFSFLGSVRSPRGIAVGIVAGLVAGAIALQAPRQVLAALKRRRLKRFNLQLVDTLVSMSNALKAGFSITQAFESVVKDGEAPISQEFDFFLQQTRLGIPFSEALNNLEQRVGSEDLTLVVLAIETARKTGGNLMEVFEKISETIRERMRIETRVRTLTAQGRLQGIIVSLMPVAIAIALMVLDPRMMQEFAYSPIGWILIGITVALIAVGGLMIRAIVNIDI